MDTPATEEPSGEAAPREIEIVAALGEIEIIERFFAPLCRSAPGAFGLQDDAAVLAPPPGADLVVTSDMTVAGVHFFPDDAPEDIARKALAVNLSDLAAKGAEPLAYNLNIALPGVPRESWLARFAAGLEACQSACGVALIGGDTTAAKDGLTIAITAFGLVPKGRMVRRAGARPGDAVYVSGTIGDAFLGLRLRRGDADAESWTLEAGEREFLLGRYLRPEPRLALRAALRGFASAALDVSDGLLLDFSRLCRASGVRGIIRPHDAPMSHAAQNLTTQCSNLLPELLAGGDDYEILCSVHNGSEADFVQAATAAGVVVTRIGEIVSYGEGGAFVNSDGELVASGRRGYEHFR
jgi:thiamine-monophosphate kinase